jgi:DNA-directed RNA polymerase beta subunit
VNEFGFIETPYRLIKGRDVSEEIKFFTATEEENKIIAQVAPEALKQRKLGSAHIAARRKGDFALVTSRRCGADGCFSKSIGVHRGLVDSVHWSTMTRIEP